MNVADFKIMKLEISKLTAGLALKSAGQPGVGKQKNLKRRKSTE